MRTIEKWSLNNYELNTLRAKLDSFDDADLLKKSQDRVGFDSIRETVTIPVYFYRVNGVIGEEDEFYDRIFTLDKKLGNYDKLYLRFDNGFDKRIDNDTINKLQPEWQQLEKRGPLNPVNIVKVIEKSQAIKRFTDPKHNQLIHKKLIAFFDLYFELNKNNIKPHEIKNILFHVVYWINIYLEKILQEFDYSTVTPKILYYGKISRREAYFLYFFNMIGGDVVYLNTEAKTPFDEIDPESKYSTPANATRHLPLKEFPKERVRSSMQTETYSASEELRETLHSDDSMFYRPWQLVDYKVTALNLLSTYEEIAILAKEQSIMRHGWEVAHGTVTIPSFFTKVLGVQKNINQYYGEVNNLKKLPKTKFFDTLPIAKKITKLLKIEYYAVCGKDNQIDVEKLINSGFWPYKHLQKHVQMLIANSVRDFCNLKGIKRQKCYSTEEQKLIIFSTMMTIDNESLQLLQMFDYPKEVPKCIIYNNENNGELIFEDSILIYFFSSVGMDVIVFNPAGHNDIEIYIEEGIYNKHHLAEVAFDLPFKSFAVLGKYIK
ncbi:MAG: YceG family protein [Bacteroidales bacterium]|nr:YceG family protein [Bacteroidales bacterium]